MVNQTIACDEDLKCLLGVANKAWEVTVAPAESCIVSAVVRDPTGAGTVQFIGKIDKSCYAHGVVHKAIHVEGTITVHRLGACDSFVIFVEAKRCPKLFGKISQVIGDHLRDNRVNALEMLHTIVADMPKEESAVHTLGDLFVCSKCGEYPHPNFPCDEAAALRK